MASPEINERGEVSLEGHLIGTIEGFRFTLARSDGDVDAKGLRAAAEQAVAPEIAKARRAARRRAERRVRARDRRLSCAGRARSSPRSPKATRCSRRVSPSSPTRASTGPLLERVQDRLSLWLRHLINTQLESVIALEAPADLEGAARGIAFRLYENLGILPRAEVADEVKGLDQDVRAKMRKLGIKFGAYHIYVPASLKPAPRELVIILYALKNGGVRQPGVAELPQIVLSGRTSFEIDPAIEPAALRGRRLQGRRQARRARRHPRAPRRHHPPADRARCQDPPGRSCPAGAAEGNGFRVTVEMTSLLGCAGDDFASILTSLGYRVAPHPEGRGPRGRRRRSAVAPEAIGRAGPHITPRRLARPRRCRPKPRMQRINEAAMNADRGRVAARRRRRAARRRERQRSTRQRPISVPPAPAPTDGEGKGPSRSSTKSGSPAAAAPRPSAPPRRAARAPRRRRTAQRRGENRPRPNASPGPTPWPAGAAPASGADRRPAAPTATASRGSRARPRAHPDSSGQGQRRAAAASERREPVFDPDSPFAALAALRNPQARVSDGEPRGRQRLDKWLFFSRAVKSRTLAQKLVESGAVRINSERTLALGSPGRPGRRAHHDARQAPAGLAHPRRGRHAAALRRRPQALYEDLSPPRRQPRHRR